MRDKEEFLRILKEINRRPYIEYGRLTGDFDFTRYVLKFGRVEEDHQPGGKILCIVRVPQGVAGFPAHLFNTGVRRTGLEDYLTRKLAAQVEGLSRFDEQGVARRQLFVIKPGQTILPRSCVLVLEDYVEARIYVELPSQRALISSDMALSIFFDDLPAVVNPSLLFSNLPAREVEEFVDLMEDADAIRQALPTRGWVGFLAEGALPARVPGGDEPNYAEDAALSVADSLRVEVQAPRAGTIKGMGIPAGVTLILGDAFSGRVELMRALASGIYNHIPGDGREMIITVPDAVYVPSCPGRSLQKVDVSAFIRGGGDAQELTTSCADTLTSQAAGVAEMLEAGARVLLLEEQDSTLEFLVGDGRLAGLLGKGSANVHSLAEHVNQLANELGVSLVISGSSALAGLIPVADTVFRMENYHIEDVTQEAKKLVRENALASGAPPALGEFIRWVVPSSVDAENGVRHDSFRARGRHILEFGRVQIDLHSLFQLEEIYQTEAIGQILVYIKERYLDQARPLREVLDLIDRDLSTEGLETLSRDLRGDLARPRRYEIAMALNRLPTLRIAQTGA